MRVSIWSYLFICMFVPLTAQAQWPWSPPPPACPPSNCPSYYTGGVQNPAFYPYFSSVHSLNQYCSFTPNNSFRTATWNDITCIDSTKLVAGQPPSGAAIQPHCTPVYCNRNSNFGPANVYVAYPSGQTPSCSFTMASCEAVVGNGSMPDSGVFSSCKNSSNQANCICLILWAGSQGGSCNSLLNYAFFLKGAGNGSTATIGGVTYPVGIIGVNGDYVAGVWANMPGCIGVC